MNFFDTLRPETTLHVLLYARVNANPDYFGLLLLHTPNPFTVVFPLLFNKVTIRIHDYEGARETLCSFDERLYECNFWIWDDENDLLRRFLANFGSSIRSLFIINNGGTGEPIMRNYRNVYGWILIHCTQAEADGTRIIRLEKLGLALTSHCTQAVRGRLFVLLERVARTVKMMRIDGTLPGDSYADMFYERIGRFTNLTIINLGNDASDNCLIIWRYIGARLQTIRMHMTMNASNTYFYETTVRIITYCPVLRELYLGYAFPRPANAAQYLTLLRVYNTQLVRAPYAYMLLPDIISFVGVCPNNLVHWPHMNVRNPLRLLALAPVLRSVILRGTEVGNGLTQGVLYLFTVLQSLQIQSNIGVETRFIFGAHIYTGLRELYLRNCIATKDAVDLVVNHIPYLETFECDTTDPFPNRDVFYPLVAVMNELRSVRLREYNADVIVGPLVQPIDSARYIRTCVGLVWAFKNAPNLRSLHIGTRSSNCDVNTFTILMRSLSARYVHCKLETPWFTILEAQNPNILSHRF